MSDDRFNVVQFFEDGQYEYVRRAVTALEAVRATQHYTTSVGARMGTTKRVIITDMLDQMCFEWTEGKITFPTQQTMDEVSDAVEKYEASEENRAESIAEARVVERNREKSK